jgi:hypothetical protein
VNLTALRRRGLVFVLTALSAGVACTLKGVADPGIGDTGTRTGRKILFIGNSLTYTNNMPLILEAMGDSAGLSPLAVADVSFPDYSLQDHVANGSALTAIGAGGWELVVLQQGSSALPENRDELRQYTAIFAERIRKANSRPALYMVWPTFGRQADWEAVIQSYTLAASDVDGLLFPVGAAWLAVWKRDPGVPLYATDGLHPSLYGSYLAATVIFARIYGKSPVGLPARLRLRNGDVISIPGASATLLQQAAAEVTGTGPT